MYNGPVKSLMKQQVEAMIPELEEIASHSASPEMTIQNILRFIASRVTALSSGWLSSVYSELSKKTLSEPAFSSPENANKFYDLELELKILDAYKLNIKDLDSYQRGLSVNEVNRIYATAGVAVGTGAVGGILLGVLSGVVRIPLVVIIAGAVVCALAGGCATYMAVPKVNQTRYHEAITHMIADLCAELGSWLDSIANYYDVEVKKLISTCES